MPHCRDGCRASGPVGRSPRSGDVARTSTSGDGGPRHAKGLHRRITPGQLCPAGRHPRHAPHVVRVDSRRHHGGRSGRVHVLERRSARRPVRPVDDDRQRQTVQLSGRIEDARGQTARRGIHRADRPASGRSFVATLDRPAARRVFSLLPHLHAPAPHRCRPRHHSAVAGRRNSRGGSLRPVDACRRLSHHHERERRRRMLSPDHRGADGQANGDHFGGHQHGSRRDRRRQLPGVGP